MMALFGFRRLMLLSDKTALVTGAAGRLGAQIARTLHQNGANLIIHYRHSKAAAQQLVDELNSERADSALAFAADLARMDDIEQLAREACAAFGGLQLLVNNASSYYPTPFGEIDEQAYDDLFASNFKAPLFLAQACQAALREHGGSIINLLDIYSMLPLAGHSVYCSAKAANRMLVKSLALELAPAIRVNGIAPGAMLWPSGSEPNEARLRQLREEVPLQRLGGAQVIADTALFLATNDYITGEVIRVDGGRMLSE